MELQQLKYFQVVARLQHMTQAAETLHVAQPSLSRSIAQLEQELGVPLFERTGRRIRLNQYGEILLRRVEDILGNLERAKREITDLQGEAQGLVVLSVSHSNSGYLLPQLLSRFRERYPGIRFQINNYQDTPHGRFALFRELEKGRMNLCLCSPVYDGVPSTQWRPVLVDVFVLAVPPDHRLATSKGVRLSEMVNEPFICLQPQTSFRDLTDALCKRAGFVPDTVIEVEDLSIIPDLVAGGCGVALIPARLERYSGKPHFPMLRLEGESTQWTMGIAWDEHSYLPLAAQLLRQFLIDFSRTDQPH